MAAKVNGVLISRDVNGNIIETNIGYINPDLTNPAKENRWILIDSSARQLNSLTTNTYVDFTLQVAYSVNEEVAD